jgi:hypothetical protein
MNSVDFSKGSAEPAGYTNLHFSRAKAQRLFGCIYGTTEVVFFQNDD